MTTPIVLGVKTGMADEARIAKAIAGPGVAVYSGIMTVEDFEKQVPSTCRAMLSFGLCGGIGPVPRIAEIIIASKLITNLGTLTSDQAWGARLTDTTGGLELPWWSTGLWNTANTPAQRQALYHLPGAPEVIDDESAAMAQFAVKHGLAFQCLRSVSDGWQDTVPPAAAVALKNDGTFNFAALAGSIENDPAQLRELATMGEYYFKSLGTLHDAGSASGPDFQWR